MVMKGSFRGAPFIILSNDDEFGRRTEVHEYPLRDEPYVEDIGKAANKKTIRVSVIGPNYESERDALITALEKAGAGTLVHPELGTVSAVAIKANRYDSTREQLKTTFSITFLIGETAPRYPTQSTSTESVLSSKATVAKAAAIENFANVFSVDDLPSALVDELQSDLATLLAEIESTVAAGTNDIADLIRSPAEMATAIIGSINNIQNLVSEPIDALNIYNNLFSAGSSLVAVPTTIESRQQQATSQQALTNLIKLGAVVESSALTSAIAFTNATDAKVQTYRITDALDAQMESTNVVTGFPIDDDLYFSLSDLHGALMNDLRIRTAQLPKIVEYTPTETLPALVVAHLIYGDATREEEIVQRNRIAHPGFIPGGAALEVLNA